MLNTQELHRFKRAFLEGFFVLLRRHRVEDELHDTEVVVLATHHDVFKRAHRVEQLEVLERPAYAQTCDEVFLITDDILVTVDKDFAFVGVERAADEVDGGRFARAVRPDQRGDLACLDCHVEMVDRRKTAERLMQVFYN
ncbi:hypothetical protein SDC9_151766 [bioreactor metagenome]|uniref:Uncharacterized protein n=1 Tax=bioreactor metagenome TaxID=1076179 RepID=A0A645ER61_9ZZZZ